ncbi:hypothetical protein Hypma_011673 [Hypsizygus marmoreus]|uniref:Mediator of RNA polymerase II transcription subunit 16 n=1 Tax=Hypsizygus marmoreus TaxID=39966 RepID=A0A369JQR7_HYPMA|nr:hypothetical protein Hypma_011673 [Hypsizygus marmoreus]
MFHDMKSTPLSPSKGKAKERRNWQTGWWDFEPLAEQSRRPVEWSQSSVIFTAHPTQPLLTARHFSSSKQFTIPSPAPVASAPGSYEPPTVISVAPGDDWLFAYFPRRDGDGTGCLWKRGAQVDSWNVKESWSLAQGAGVVAASWLGTPREWVVSSTGASTRLPPRGPRTPVSSPTLILVTQDNRINVCFFRYYVPHLKIMSCSLTQPGITMEAQPNLGTDKGASSVRQCFRAAIGLAYNDTSILIATRSYILPPPMTNASQFDATHPTLPGEMPPDLLLEDESMGWECCGEELNINLCEVQLRFNGLQMSLYVEPLPPIVHAGASLVDLNFICTPPPETEQPSLSPKMKKNSEQKGHTYLASAYLDFGDYASTPKSELVLHTITRQPPTINSNSNKSTWIYHKNAVRSFTPSVLTFVSPCSWLGEEGRNLVYAGIVDTFGTLRKPSLKRKEAIIGRIRALNLSDLTDNDLQPSPILSTLDRVGQDLPLNAAPSPNGALICTVSSSLWPVQTSIHTSPRPRASEDVSGLSIPPLAAALAAATFARKTASDITHALSLATTPISEVSDTLHHAINILENNQNGIPNSFILPFLGEAMVVYRHRATNVTDNKEKDLLTARWKIAHDICSLAACNRAFEDCQDGDTYDLDAVWQLIGLSTWVVSLTERIMRECVLSCDVRAHGTEPQPPSAGTSTPLNAPILLFLGHPFAFQNFGTALGHVTRYRAYLGSLSAKGEVAQIARDVLIDLVDSSGVDFAALGTLLVSLVQECQALDGDTCREALAACQPTPAMQPYLSNAVNKVAYSKVLNKPTLFIKPYDLVDGVGRSSIAPRKDKDKDVVSKGVLNGQVPSLTCLSCGGKSEVGVDVSLPGITSLRWRGWEKMWSLRCICGGSWTSIAT